MLTMDVITFDLTVLKRMIEIVKSAANMGTKSIPGIQQCTARLSQSGIGRHIAYFLLSQLWRFDTKW
jgi:hypothetical protein